MTAIRPADQASQRHLLWRIIAEAQAGIDAGALLRPHLAALDPAQPYLVLGAGKAAGAMARAVAKRCPQARGLVVTTQAEPPAGGIEIIGAAHPVPDETSVAAAKRILALARAARPDEEILFLLSGGASSLMALPAPGLALADKQAMTRALLASGAPIGDINIVRKHLSAIKGGRLAAATRAAVHTFALSDVPGDDPAAIGSGPTVPDTSVQGDAREILARWRVAPSPAVAAALAHPRQESLKNYAPGLRRDFTLIGGPDTVLGILARIVAREGFEPVNLGAVEGEARHVAAEQAQLALQRAESGRPCALISGGELSVTLGGAAGAGGRCREFLLALALAGCQRAGICAAAWDSDGVDGVGPEAGALLFADSLERASVAGIDPQAMLNRHESGAFFAEIGDSVSIGAQPTNIGDLRLILVGAS